MDELVEQNNVTEPKISDILYEYLDRYPEDAPKWVEYFNSRKTRTIRRRRNYNPEAADQIIEAMNFPIETDMSVNITHETGCLHSKKTWLETPRMATMDMLCGHKYHTICVFLSYHDNDNPFCLVDGCNHINTMSIVNRISTLRNRTNNEIEQILTEAILENKNFQSDLKLIKDRFLE